MNDLWATAQTAQAGIVYQNEARALSPLRYRRCDFARYSRDHWSTVLPLRPLPPPDDPVAHAAAVQDLVRIEADKRARHGGSRDKLTPELMPAWRGLYRLVGIDLTRTTRQAGFMVSAQCTGSRCDGSRRDFTPYEWAGRPGYERSEPRAGENAGTLRRGCSLCSHDGRRRDYKRRVEA